MLKIVICTIFCFVALTSRAQSREDLVAQVQWINIESIELAIEDMVANHGVDASLFERDLDELKTLINKGFDGLNSGKQHGLKGKRNHRFGLFAL